MQKELQDLVWKEQDHMETKIHCIVLLERASHVIHSLLQQVSIASELLDQGGPRGECTGLSSFLNEIIITLKNQYGDLPIYLEDMFHDDNLVDTSILTTTNLEGDDSIQSLQKDISTTTTKTMSDLLTTITTPVVDLITMGIWIPLATVLTADPAMKMAIFSQGIAHVLQAN